MPPNSPSHTRLLFAAVLTLASLMASGCGAVGSRDPFAEATPAETRLAIFVENRGFNDIRLYALTARGTRSLGRVGGSTTRRIDLQWRQLDQISFRIEVLAGRRYDTPAVSAQPGDRVQVTIPSDPANTFVSVR